MENERIIQTKRLDGRDFDMEQELKKIISNLTEREAKSILLNMLLTVNMHRNDDGSKDGFYEQMIDIFDEFQKMREQLHKKRSNQVVHIVSAYPPPAA